MKNRRDFMKTSALGISGLFGMSKMSLLASDKRNSLNGAPPRFIFLRKSSGIFPSWLVPPSLKDKETAMEVALDKHDLPDWMEPLEKHKKHLTLLQGLSAKMCAMGHSTYQSPLAVCKAQGGRVNSIPRASVDVVLGGMFPTPFGHVELTSTNQRGVINGLSSFGPRQPNIAFASPKAAYENLFAYASDDKNVHMKNELESNMYKFLHGNLAEMNKRKKSKDNFRKYDTYTQSIEAVLKRNNLLYSMRDKIKKHAPKMSAEIMNNQFTTAEQHLSYVDIAIASMRAGLTNSITFTLDILETQVSGIPGVGPIGLHNIGHNKTMDGMPALEVRKKLRIHHMSVVDKLVEGLKKTPEGDGTMFDNTIIMYLPENGESHHSRGTAVPFVILSGDKVQLDIGGGRYIRLPEYSNTGHKTIGNFYTTILNAYGNPIKHYGDKDVGIKFDQEGSIKQLMND